MLQRLHFPYPVDADDSDNAFAKARLFIVVNDVISDRWPPLPMNTLAKMNGSAVRIGKSSLEVAVMLPFESCLSRERGSAPLLLLLLGTATTTLIK